MKKTLTIWTCILFIIFLITPIFATSNNNSSSILKQTVLGAGIGAVAASASGGKAGKGALVGAGTNLVGNLLFNAIGNTGSQSQYLPQQKQPQQRQVQQYKAVPQRQIQQYKPQFNNKYNQTYSLEYKRGYKEGYTQGYKDGYHDSREK